MEVRVTTAARKDFTDAGSVADAAYLSQVSCTASSASHTLPRIL